MLDKIIATFCILDDLYSDNTFETLASLIPR